MELNKVYHGKMQEVLLDLDKIPDNSVDCIGTDPNYGISFMNLKWDYDVPTVEQWQLAYKKLKPGGWLFAFSSPRTYHRTAVNIEDAGFEIRDQMMWIHGEGFPKSMDISKAIDKQAGAEREVIGQRNEGMKPKGNGIMNFNGRDVKNGISMNSVIDITEPATDEARQWDGWGTALKPAHEPICIARKPIECKTVADNVLKYGTGAINIAAGRIPFESEADLNSATWGRGTDITSGNFKQSTDFYTRSKTNGKTDIPANSTGRWPANVIFDEHAAEILNQQSGTLTSGTMKPLDTAKKNDGIFNAYGKAIVNHFPGSEGGASRFFYCAKPDNNERDKGLLKNFALKECGIKNDSGRGYFENDPYAKILKRNTHPTVKPIKLMRYLVRLFCPKGGILLDPFCGSGSTLIGCKLELINYIGIDMILEHVELSEARVLAWNPDLYLPQTLFGNH